MEQILKDLLMKKTKDDKDLIYFQSFFDNDDKKKILEIISKINTRKLYSSDFHGIHHSEKVLIFAYLIAKHYNLNDTEKKIIYDAAIYHDIGRLNDDEEVFHGYKSAMEIMDAVDDKIYDDEVNIGYLRAIVEVHSCPDSQDNAIFANYQYDYPNLDYETYKRLNSILKDADALDRTRFGKTSSVALKSQFLRLDYSKELVEFAYKVNDLYSKLVAKKNYKNIKDKYINNDGEYGCFHGIGFDFFSLESILKNGILSNYAMDYENICKVRSFNGNNGDLWVSVVPATEVVQNGKALNNFVMTGISFYCIVNHLMKGKKISKSKVRESGIPRYSGEYIDEQFVFDKIRLDQIKYLIIAKDVRNVEINKVDYFNCAYNYDIIKNKVNSYRQNIKQKFNYDCPYNEVLKLLKAFENLNVKYESTSISNQRKYVKDYMDSVDELVKNINTVIQLWMEIGYKQYYNIPIHQKVTVEMVVRQILKENGYYIDLLGEEEAIYDLSSTLKHEKLK